MNDERADFLEARILRLEQQVAALRKRLGIEEARAASQPAAVAEPAPAIASRPITAPRPTPSPAPAPQVRAQPAFSFEAFIGGRLLLGVGVLAFFLGIGFFLKYAIDNGWIGPAGRVTLGLIAGSAFLIASEPMLRRGFKYYSEALTGLGAAILYVSLFSAGELFKLIPLSISFLLMVMVTAAVMTLALRRDSERLAFIALLGGYVTPLLNSSSDPQIRTLLIYIGVLNSALLWLPRKSAWPRITAAAFVATQLYFWGTYVSRGTTGALSMLHIVAATAFFAQFSAVPVLQARSNRRLRPYELALAVATAAIYYFALHVNLYDSHRLFLTASIVALAALYLVMAQITAQQTRDIFAAIALALITIGVGVTFTGDNLAIVWALEGGALVFIGTRSQTRSIKIFGALAFLCALLRFYLAIPPGGAFLINERFATYLVFCVGFACAAYAGRRFAERVTTEKPAYQLAEVLANAALLLGLSQELMSALSHPYVLLAALWALDAIALTLAGRRDRLTRWQSYGVLTVGALLLAARITAGCPGSGLPPYVEQSATLAIAALALGAACFAGLRMTANTARHERDIFTVFGVASAASLLAALSFEVWRLSWGSHLLLSLLWLAYGVALLAVGMKRTQPLARWLGLALLAVVFLKAFIIDLSTVDPLIRIGSFIATGVVLLAVAFVYQRTFARGQTNPE